MAVLPKMTIVSIDDLEESLGEKKLLIQAAAYEQAFTEQIKAVALQAKDPSIRAILISGPTASGKTTTSHRLQDLLASYGRKPVVLSLDDYFLTQAILYDEAGRPDFESIKTIDIELIAQDILSLICNGTALPPTFDFKCRSRSFEPDRRICLDSKGILLVEGLHALAGEITDNLPHDQCIRIFIMPYGALHVDRHLLDSRDIRILRRIARDVRHRGSTALSTIDYWPMLDKAENDIFPPYLARADIMINSTLPYEFLVVAPIAARYINDSLEQYKAGTLPGSFYCQGGIGYADLPLALREAQRLYDATRMIPAVSPIIVPPMSILHEFIS